VKTIVDRHTIDTHTQTADGLLRGINIDDLERT